MKRLLILLAILILCGCAHPDGKKKALGPFDVDRSHTPLEAIKHGAPSVEKTWVPADYMAFRTYVANLPRDSYARANSANSKALFTKFVDSVEQPILTKTDIPLKKRFTLSSQIRKAVNDTLMMYYFAHTSGTDYSTELAYLQGVTLTLTRQSLVLLDEFTPTIDPKEKHYEARMQGLQKVKNGLAMQLDGTIVSLQDTTAFSDAERYILANYLVAEASFLLDHLDSNVRKEFDVKFKTLVSSETNSEIRQVLTRLPRM